MPRNLTKANRTQTTTTTGEKKRDVRNHGLTFHYDETLGAPHGVPTSITVAKELCIDSDGDIPAIDQTFDVYTEGTAAELGRGGYVSPVGVLTRAFISIVNQYHGGDLPIQLNVLRSGGQWVVRDNIAIARLKGLAARITTSVPPKRGSRVHDTVEAGAKTMKALRVETNLYVVGGPPGSSHVDALIVPDESGTVFNDEISMPTSFVIDVLPKKSYHYLKMLRKRSITPPPFMVEAKNYRFDTAAGRGTYALSLLVNGEYVTYKMTVTPGVWRTVKGDTTGHCRFIVEWPVPEVSPDAMCRVVFAGVVDRVDDGLGYLGEGSGAVTAYGMEDNVVTKSNSKNALTMRVAGQVRSTNVAETKQVGDWYRQFGHEAGSSWGFIGGAVTALNPALGTLITVESEKHQPYAALMGYLGQPLEELAEAAGVALKCTENISRAVRKREGFSVNENYIEYDLPVAEHTSGRARQSGDIFVLMHNRAPAGDAPDLIEVGRGRIRGVPIRGDQEYNDVLQPLARREVVVNVLTMRLSGAQRTLGGTSGGTQNGYIKGGAEVHRLLQPTATKSELGTVTDGSYCVLTEYSPSSVCGIEVEELLALPSAQDTAETILTKVMGGGFKKESARWFIQQLTLSAAADRRQTTGRNGKLRRVNELDFWRAIIATVVASKSVADAAAPTPGSSLTVTGAREGSDGVIHEVSAHDLQILSSDFPVSSSVTRAGGIIDKDALTSTKVLMVDLFRNSEYTPYNAPTGPVDFLTLHQMKRYSRGHIAELNGEGTFVYLDKIIAIFQDKCQKAVGAMNDTPRFFRMFTGETVLFFYSTAKRDNRVKNKALKDALKMEGVLVCARQRKTAASLNTAFGGR